MTTGFPVYESPAQALEATNLFYAEQEGFQYTDEKVTAWIQAYVKLPAKGRVLDLCCGDGIWAKGMKMLNPALEIHGIDISEGAIAKAKTIMGEDAGHFIVGDTERVLPYQEGFFDLVFARGPGLYNQHSMDRPATIAVIEMWHRILKPSGRFYSIFASRPDKMGSYTDMEDAKLPYNRCPRKTETIDFLGGKYHHSVETFHAPFWKAQNVKIERYTFAQNLHILVTRLQLDTDS